MDTVDITIGEGWAEYMLDDGQYRFASQGSLFINWPRPHKSPAFIISVSSNAVSEIDNNNTPQTWIVDLYISIEKVYGPPTSHRHRI